MWGDIQEKYFSLCGHTYQTLHPAEIRFSLLESARPHLITPAGPVSFLTQIVPSPSATMPKNPWAPNESPYDILIERIYITDGLICGVGYGESLSLHTRDCAIGFGHGT